MDLLSTIRKSGSRGGVNFSWDEVANSTHRENYLGHSLKAPVGRWQNGRDLNWYAKADSVPADSTETHEERQERDRKEELRKIKEVEEDAIARALGLPVKQRDTTGANAVEVEPKRLVGPATGPPADEPRRERSRRHGDHDRRERRRHRSRSRSRSRDRGRDRDRDRDRGHRRRSREGERVGHDGRDERRHRRERDRSRSAARQDQRQRDRSRERYRSRSRGNRRRSPDAASRRWKARPNDS